MNDPDKPEVPNPKASANVFSSFLYLWTLPVYKRAFGRELETSDLFAPLNEHSSGRLGDTFSQYWKNELLSGNPSVLRVICNCFKWHLLIFFLLTFIVDCVLRVTQPIIIGEFLKYFELHGGLKTASYVYIYGLALIASCLLSTLISQSVSMGLTHMGLKIKIGISSLIYRKALRLSKSSLSDTTVSHISNLLTRDATVLESFVPWMNYLIVAPLHLIITTYYLWKYIGISSLVGVGLLLIIVPLNIWLGLSSYKSDYFGGFTNAERIEKTNEAISGIKTIKILTWEDIFTHTINKLRNKELHLINLKNYANGTLVSLDMFLTRLALFLSILCYVLLDNTVTAEKLFVVVTFYILLKHTLTVLFPKAIISWGEFRGSLIRIQRYMLYEESNKPSIESFTKRQYTAKYENLNAYDSTDELTVPLHIGNNVREIKLNVSRDNLEDDDVSKSKTNDDESDGPRLTGVDALQLEKVFAKWNAMSSEFVVNSMSLKIKNGCFVAVIGEADCGKSTLFNVILQELPVTSGMVDVFGDVSYASQDPWLFNDSVKKNILFGSKLDKMRYKNVIEGCTLKHDLMTLTNGDKFIIKEFGANLTEGQRVRINLARAVYRNVDIYLLDDPLVSVDVHTGQLLFDNCFLKFLHGRTRILATRQTQYLNEVDHIVLIKDGSVAAEGTYAYLQENSQEFKKFLASESKKSSNIANERILKRRKEQKSMVRMSSELIEGSVDNLPNARKHKTENTIPSAVESYVHKAYYSASGSVFFAIGVLLLAIGSQVLASAIDYWTSYWINKEEKYATYCQKTPARINNNSAKELYGVFEEMLSKNSSTISPIGEEYSSSVTMLDITTEVSRNFSSLMVNDIGPNNSTTTNTTSVSGFCCEEMKHEWFLQIYGILIASLIVAIFIRSFSFFWTTFRTSHNLHSNMLEAIMKAQIRFFSLNASGKIINRFSKDIKTIDHVLPQKLLFALQNCLQVAGIVIITIYINWWLLFLAMFSFGLLLVLRLYYIPVSRSTDRLVETTKGSGLSHTSASLKGITTIRAFGNQRQLEKEFDSLQNVYSSACYLNLSTRRAFALWADFVCLLFITLTTCSFIYSRHSVAGDVGLLLSQAIGLTMVLQYGLRMSSEVENDMISVERVLDYTDIELEPPSIEMKDYQLPTFWPPFGEIKFNNVWVRYSPTRGPAICDLNILIEAKQRIGIVGRTGSGKSSIINALFRLPFMDGFIEIDGVRTDTLGLQVLRSKISVIPQEPMLFSGSVRTNLDPYNTYNDADLLKALDKVELKDKISDFGGLNAYISEDAKSFDIGQKQLLYLARALLKQNRIVVFDETTEMLDQRIDDLIQRILRTEFKDSTVLIIAHRMDVVIDSHKVLVMDGGKSVEYDHAHILLQNDSFLTSMVAKTGLEKEQSLRSIAKKNYEDLIRSGDIKQQETAPVQIV